MRAVRSRSSKAGTATLAPSQLISLFRNLQYSLAIFVAGSWLRA